MGRSVTILLGFLQCTERPLQVKADMGVDRPFGSVAGHRGFLDAHSFLADRQGGLQFKTAHERQTPAVINAVGPWRYLARRSWRFSQVGARPFARFDARRKRPEINH